MAEASKSRRVCPLCRHDTLSQDAEAFQVCGHCGWRARATDEIMDDLTVASMGEYFDGLSREGWKHAGK